MFSQNMNAGHKERIGVALACRDSDCIPKVSNAGSVINSGAPDSTYQMMHNGIRVYTNSHYGDFNTEVIQGLRGHHEPQEEKVFHEVLKAVPANSSMLELGSWWAYYSMWFHSAVNGARNFMVEPMQDGLRHGARNFVLNEIEGGDFTQACVGRDSKTHTQFKNWDGSLYDMPQICVDDFLELKCISYLEILHADIQGAEYEMLLGAQKGLATRKIGFVFVSTHSEALHAQCLQFLLDMKYWLVAEHSPWESYATDGLIVVSNPDKRFPPVSISKRRYAFRIQARLNRLWRQTICRVE